MIKMAKMYVRSRRSLTWRSVFTDGLAFHANSYASLKATKLTLITRLFVDRAGLILATLVLQVLLNSSLEKPFATFATVNAIVIAAAAVAANGT